MSQLTREQIGEMVSQMENAVCCYVKRSIIPERFWDDFMQDIRLELCKAARRFDPSRGVKWSSYAISYIKGFIKSWLANSQSNFLESNSEDFEGTAENRTSRFEDYDINRHHVTEDEDEEDAPFRALSLGLKRNLAEPILSKLTPKQRELIEALVFDGFTVEQFAGRRGYPVRIVRANLKNTLRMMAEAGLVEHVISDADAGRILNKDQSPIQRGQTLKKIAEYSRRARAAILAERERGSIMQAAATHPDAGAVLDAMGADVARAVRAYLAGECSFNAAASRCGLTARMLGKRCCDFRKLAEVGQRDVPPVDANAPIPHQPQAPNPPPIAPPLADVVTDERPVLKGICRAPLNLEAVNARKRWFSLRAKHEQRNHAFQRAAEHPAAPAELALLADDVRVALLGYLAGEWDFDQAADLAGLNSKSFGLRVQRFKELSTGNRRPVPPTPAEQRRERWERQRGPIMKAAARHPDADATLAALGEETASAVRAYLAGSMNFNAAAESLGESPCKLGYRLRAFRRLAAVEPPVSTPAVSERNTSDTIASVGHPLTA